MRKDHIQKNRWLSAPVERDVMLDPVNERIACIPQLKCANPFGNFINTDPSGGNYGHLPR